MISRVADYCFWFGRYLDRAESSARLLQATRALASDSDVPVKHCWQPLVIVSGEERPFIERHGREALGNGELVQRYMTWSKENLVSLSNSARSARECARAIRDQLSHDAWEAVNELHWWLNRETTASLYEENREEFYRTVRSSTQLVLGLLRSTMLHEEPLSFLWTGVMLERAGQTARILDMHHHTMAREAAHDIVQVALWMSLLRACSGSEAFMKKHQGRITATSVVKFLLFAPSFPRSLRYCLRSGHSMLHRIWPEPVGVRGRPSIERLDSLLARLDEQESVLDLSQLHELLTSVVDETSATCMHIAREIQGPVPTSEGGQSQSSSHAPGANSQTQYQ